MAQLSFEESILKRNSQIVELQEKVPNLGIELEFWL